MVKRVFGFQQLTVTVKTVALVLIFYTFSISLTFYNKWMIKRFHFPLSVSVVHYFMVFLLSAMARWCWEFKTEKKRVMLTWLEYMKRVSPTAVSSALDIGLSNWSLMFITVSLYTMAKSTSIIFILIFALVFGIEKWHTSLLAIVLLISSGLFMFTYESTQFNGKGFVIALTASALSGIRWTTAQILMQKNALGLRNPVDTLYHVQPIMTLALMPLAFVIEGPSMASSPQLFAASSANVAAVSVTMVMFGCFLAFMLSVSEYLLLSHTSSLTLSVSGIFKETCTLALATEFAGDRMNFINFIGLVICLTGIAAHVWSKATKEPNSVETQTKETKLEWPKNKEETRKMLPMTDGGEEEDYTEYEVNGHSSYR